MSRLNWMLVCVGLLAVTCMSFADTQKPTLSPDEEQALMDATDKPVLPKHGMMGEGRRRGERMGEGEGPMQPPPPRGPIEELTPEQEARLFTILKEVNPELIEKIKTWQEVNPNRSSRMLARMYERMQDLIELKTVDPAMYELRVQDIKLDARSRVLASEYRRQKTDEGRKELVNILTEHFEVRQKIREHELERLKSKIGQLESQLEERASNRQKYIDKQLDEITRKPGSAKW